MSRERPDRPLTDRYGMYPAVLSGPYGHQYALARIRRKVLHHSHIDDPKQRRGRDSNPRSA